MKIPSKLPKIDVARQVEGAVKTAKAVQQASKPALDTFEKGAKLAVGVATSSAAYGKSIGVDNSATAPRRFDYGATKKTLAEFDTSSADRSGARARLFGEASLKTLSAALGAEGEAGLKSKFRDDDREQTCDAFAGVRGRVFGEAGLLGASVGAEGFAGGEVYSQEGDERGGQSWVAYKSQLSAGIRGAAIASAGVTGLSASALIQAGLEYRGSTQMNNPVVGPLGVMQTTEYYAFAGGRAAAGAGLGPTGFGAGAEAFAGVKAGMEERIALSAGGAELLGAALRVEGWAGAGAKAELDAGFDPKKGEFAVKGEAGAALGVGAGVSGGVTFNGGALKSFASEGSSDD